MKKYLRSNIASVIFVIIFTLSLNIYSLVAQDEPAGPNNPAEIEAFFDDLIPQHLEEYGIAGAAVTVVRDGEVLFAEGYGYADVENDVAVDPETTLFRMGSLTKLLTWTAIMQLYERGELELDVDVNTYLTDFQIPDTYDTPITLTHLLGHTAGFEDRAIGLAARDESALTPTDEWLAQNMPARIRPPGELISYSNYGTTLAGYIVEQVSGVPYEQYIAENILQPLAMSHTTLQQPPPADLSANLSNGYALAGNQFVAADFEYLQVVPAGAMSSSAADIANFMIAHLQDGTFNGQQILEAETAQLMHSTTFTHDPRVNGFSHGFMEMSRNGQRIIGHSGDTEYFYSVMALLPDDNAGVFVSYNSVGGIALNIRLFLNQFMDHYYPIAEASEATIQSDLSRYAGSYRMSRGAYTTGEKVLGLLSPISISMQDNAIIFNSVLGSQKFVEVDPLYFEETSGDDRLVFFEDEQGAITHASLRSVPTIALLKVAWYQSANVHLMVLLYGLILFASLLLIIPVNWFVRRRSGQPPQPRFAQISRWVAGIAAFLNIGFVLVLVTADQRAFAVGDTTRLMLASSLAFVAAWLTIGVVVFAVLAWVRRYWEISGRIHYTLLTIALIGFAWSLNYWNLFTFQF